MSGSGRRARELIRLVQALKRQGFTPRLYSRRDEMEAAVQDPISRQHLKGIVAAGGDGTVLDVANRFPGIPIGVLPLGTENLFALALGLGCCGKTLATLIANGHTARFDCAHVNDRRFLVVASAGFDAEVIHLAHARRTGRITRWFYAAPILIALTRYSFPVVTVTLDDDPATYRACLVLVSNLSRYALGLPIAPQARGNDGLLDVCLFEAPGRWRLFRDLMSVLQGTHHKQPHVAIRQAKRVVITAEDQVPLQLDGDPAGRTPATIEVEAGAIDVFMPAPLRA